jgi:poly(3-hydroxybutyrate) depolymerase
MSDIVSILLLVALVLGMLAATTSLGIARLESAHPPTGQFVEVQGVRLHVAVIGLPRGAPGAEPAIVLIHGASGNLEDMRLALGEKLASSAPGHLD